MLSFLDSLQKERFWENVKKIFLMARIRKQNRLAESLTLEIFQNALNKYMIQLIYL